jgi:hypothetical protein
MRAPSSNRTLLAGLLLAIGGLAGLYGLRTWLDGLSTADPAAALPVLTLVLWGMVALVALSLAGTAALLWRVAARATAAQRFPPPGVTVVGRVPILTGAAALRRARLLRLIAGFLGLMALVVPAMMTVVLDALLR